METILSNPVLLIAVLIIAFVIGKVLKLAKKIIGIIICIVIAGFIVLRFMV